MKSGNVRACVVLVGILGYAYLFHGGKAATDTDSVPSASAQREYKRDLDTWRDRAENRPGYPVEYSAADWTLRTGLPGLRIAGADDDLLFLMAARGLVWLDTASGTADIVHAEGYRYLRVERDSAVLERDGTRYTVSLRDRDLAVTGNGVSQTDFSLSRATAVLSISGGNTSHTRSSIIHYVDTVLAGGPNEGSVYSTEHGFVIVRTDGCIEHYTAGESRSE